MKKRRENSAAGGAAPRSVFLEYLQHAAGVPFWRPHILALPLRWHPEWGTSYSCLAFAVAPPIRVVLCAVKQGTLYGEGTIEGNLPRSRANAVPHQRPISDVDAERIGKRLLRQVAGSA